MAKKKQTEENRLFWGLVLILALTLSFVMYRDWRQTQGATNLVEPVEGLEQ